MFVIFISLLNSLLKPLTLHYFIPSSTITGETPAFGPPHWVAGAIGNCTWTGVRLRDLLRVSGMDVDAISLRTKERPVKATHVGLLGYDHDECGNQYCCSFPFDKAIDPYGDVIVAFSKFFYFPFIHNKLLLLNLCF